MYFTQYELSVIFLGLEGYSGCILLLRVVEAEEDWSTSFLFHTLFSLHPIGQGHIQRVENYALPTIRLWQKYGCRMLLCGRRTWIIEYNTWNYHNLGEKIKFLQNKSHSVGKNKNPQPLPLHNLFVINCFISFPLHSHTWLLLLERLAPFSQSHTFYTFFTLSSALPS